MISTLPKLGRVLVGAMIVLAPTAMAAGTALADATGASTPTVASGLSPSTINCPVDGPTFFFDSWGAPRSGGRSHLGADMEADRNTPIVAATDGYAEFKHSNAGGNAIWLTTAEGDKFYYAHLEGWEGESREVTAGERIGYVGSSGNAGGPHLHFEVHPGGTPTNPTPYVAEACRPKPVPVIIYW